MTENYKEAEMTQKIGQLQKLRESFKTKGRDNTIVLLKGLDGSGLRRDCNEMMF